MRWYKDNNIKRAANKTLCFAVQWLNFPKQAQSQTLTTYEQTARDYKSISNVSS